MIDNVLGVIQQKTGTLLRDARLQRIQQMIEAWEKEGRSTREIYSTLLNNPLEHPLWRHVIQQITVGETYFFRNQLHFNALQSQLFPQLIRQRRKQNQLFLRIWVAGCATGEEPYSIAMLLQDLIPDIERWSIFLLATDINEAFLAFAREGVYRERAFRNETPNHIQGRWFTKREQGYAIQSRIRQMVTFGHLNLVEQAYPAMSNNTVALDLILCRNVTIYFDRPTTQTIVSRFYEALRPEGWLIVGHSEPQPTVYDSFQIRNMDGAIFYQKIQQQPTRQAAVVPRTPDPVDITHPVLPIPELAPAPVEAAPALDHIAEAQMAADRANWEQALSILVQVEGDDPFNPMLHYLRGLIFSHTDKPDQAVRAFSRAVYCAPQFALAHYALGEQLHQQGKETQATASWRRAQKNLRGLCQDDAVMGAPDLTVEMLNDLLSFRLG